MIPVSYMAFFCEDIREEKNDTVSLVGLLPDFMNVNKSAEAGVIEQKKNTDPVIRVLSKLCVYGRINFDPDYDLPTPQLNLTAPDGQTVRIGEIAADIVQKARQEAKERGNILAGVVFRGVFERFQLPKMGSVKLEIVLGKETYLAAALNFQEQAISSSESVQPS